MKVSAKGQYALEALLDLHLNARDGQETLPSIAQHRGISEHYLEQIFATLRRAGIVASVRGAQGGYRLAMASEDITAGMVIRALEGPLLPVKCTNDSRPCPMKENCATRPLWVRVAREIDSAVDAVTLADLAHKHGVPAEENPEENND